MPSVRVVVTVGLPDPDRLSTTSLWSVLAHIGLFVGILIYQALPDGAPDRGAAYFVRLAAPAGLGDAGPTRGSGSPVAPLVPIEKAPPPAPAPPRPKRPAAARSVQTPPTALAPPKADPPTGAPAPAPAAGEREQALTGQPSGQAPGQAPSAPAGGIGGTELGGGEFQYDWYRVALEEKLRQEWRSPIATAPAIEKAIVTFRILRDGSVKEVTLLSASGNGALDLSVMSAVYNAAPLPPLPKSWAKDSVDVSMEFQLIPGPP